MVVLFFHEGTRAEVGHCNDVVHKPGLLICLDDAGAPIASFLDSDVLGYSLNPAVKRAVIGDGLEVSPGRQGPKMDFTEVPDDPFPPQGRSDA